MNRRRFLQLGMGALAMRAARATALYSPPPPQRPLAQALARVFWEWVGDGSAYRALYNDVLGVVPQWTPQRPGANPTAQPLQSKVIRYGYYMAAPYHRLEEGRNTGFDYQVGNELARRLGLRAEWVEQKVVLPGGGDDTELAYQQLYDGLHKGLYDCVFSGLLIRPNRPVEVIAPTMRIFPLPLYTGRGEHDFSALQNTDIQTFVAAAAALPAVILTCTQGGPSDQICGGLVRDIQAAGGKPEFKLATAPDLSQSIKNQTVDFVVGDALALTMESRRPGFRGLNLNIDLDPAGGELIGPFTLA